MPDNFQESKPLFDLKATIKRRKEILQICLVILCLNGIIKALGGLTISVYVIACLSVIMVLLLITNSKGLVKFTKAGFILSLCTFLISLTIVEGLRASAHLYLIPLIVAIPAIVENNKLYTKEIVTYFVIITTCFCFCIYFGEERSSFQYISESLYNTLNTVNNSCVVILCTVFSFLNVYNERKYAKALLNEKIKAEEAGFAKTKFLSSMGHELRTPLNGIVGATSILRREDSFIAQKEYFDILHYCSSHMLQLVNDLLDFNKIEGNKFQLNPVIFNLKDLMEQCYITFNNRFEEKKVALKLILDKGLETGVFADDTRLIQIFNNLISNAWKFTDKGEVKISAIILEEDPDQLIVEFKVEDTGIGIDEDSIKRIFESFWQVYHESTRKYSGTGLGLSISQNILKLMGSALRVDSEVNQGTSFYFTIKFERAIFEIKESKRVSSPADLSGIRILIAEDNPINLLIARKMLLDQNAVITTCTNGLEALETLSKNEDFDIILLDLEMPVMDGYTAIIEIVKNYSGIPVLAFTASLLDREMIAHLMELGFIDYISKPVTSVELKTKIIVNTM